MPDEIEEPENLLQLALLSQAMYNKLVDLLQLMSAYGSLLDPDKPFESYIAGRTKTWVIVLEAYREELETIGMK